MTAFETLTSSQSNEWYTPPSIIEKARRVLGGIDLDPASNETAQRWIKANRYYGQAEDGMQQSWHCSTMWLNPPYGQKRPGVYGASAWLEKLHQEYQAGNVGKAIALARGDSKGLKLLQRNYAFVMCDRISFLREDGTTGSQPVPGSFIFALMPDISDFLKEFSTLGIIVKAVN